MKREVNVHGHVFGLTAAPHVSGGWRATVTSHAETSHADGGGTPGAPRPQPDPEVPSSPVPIGEAGWSGHGGTADAALNALQRQIHAAIREAAAAEKKALLDEANPRRETREPHLRPPAR